MIKQRKRWQKLFNTEIIKLLSNLIESNVSASRFTLQSIKTQLQQLRDRFENMENIIHLMKERGIESNNIEKIQYLFLTESRRRDILSEIKDIISLCSELEKLIQTSDIPK